MKHHQKMDSDLNLLNLKESRRFTGVQSKKPDHTT